MRKNNKRKNSIISLFLIALLTAGTLCAPAEAVSQGDIDALRRERDALAEEKKVRQQIAAELESEKNDVVSTKLALDEQMVCTQQQIDLNTQEIELYDSMIAEKAAEVDEARELEERQLELLRSRVRAMEENGEMNILAILFNAESVGGLIAALDDAGQIMQHDRNLEDEYIAAREHHEQVKAEYEAYRAELVSKQEVLSAERELLEEELAATRARLEELQRQISESEELLAEMEERWSSLNSEISELEAAYSSQHSPGSLAGEGGFIWPCGSYYITSRCGNRYHPVTGETKFHSGVDIGAGEGSPIWAAASGTVSLAGWNGGYGNCVMIDHGGYTTLYGHLSSISVSAGEGVSQGQNIGAAGSTGLATGAHLHFEIRGGGSYLDPENFFPEGSFSFAPDA